MPERLGEIRLPSGWPSARVGGQAAAKASQNPEPMKKAPLADNEEQRLAALRALNILDTPPEERFDRITRLARKLFEVPIALITLVDADRQWFKSCQGLRVRATPRDISFCGHAILSEEGLVVPDTLLDERFADNPMVSGEPASAFTLASPCARLTEARWESCASRIVARIH